MAVRKIKIEANPPVAIAVPGVLKANKGDFIEIENKTGARIIVFTADGGVLEDAERLQQKYVNKNQKRKFKVEAVSGTHELSIHYRYYDAAKKKYRAGFAVGASSPKIVVIPPKKR